MIRSVTIKPTQNFRQEATQLVNDDIANGNTRKEDKEKAIKSVMKWLESQENTQYRNTSCEL